MLETFRLNGLDRSLIAATGGAAPAQVELDPTVAGSILTPDKGMRSTDPQQQVDQQ